jgi:hypothetical protein
MSCERLSSNGWLDCSLFAQDLAVFGPSNKHVLVEISKGNPCPWLRGIKLERNFKRLKKLGLTMQRRQQRSDPSRWIYVPL